MALRSWTGRAIGLDVHREFCVVAICEDGQVRSGARVPSTPEGLALPAQSLVKSDRVALEVTGSCWELAPILEPHVDRVVVVSPDDTGITQARAKTDRLDARTLARLLWSGALKSVWMPDERCRVLRRRLARREQLVHSRREPRTRSTPCCSVACKASRRARTCSASRAASGSRPSSSRSKSASPSTPGLR